MCLWRHLNPSSQISLQTSLSAVLIRNIDVSWEVVYFFISRSMEVSPERSQSVFSDMSSDFHSSVLIRNMDISQDVVYSVLSRSTAITLEASQFVFLDMTLNFPSTILIINMDIH